MPSIKKGRPEMRIVVLAGVVTCIAISVSVAYRHFVRPAFHDSSESGGQMSLECGGKSICQGRVGYPPRPQLTRASSNATLEPPEMVGLVIAPPGRGAIGLNARAGFHAIGLLNDGTAKNVTDLAHWSIDDTTVASTLFSGSPPGYVTAIRPGQTMLRAAIEKLTTSTGFETKDCPPLPSTHPTTGEESNGAPGPEPASGHPRCAVRNSQQSSGPDCFGADANDPSCALAHPLDNHCGHDGQSCCFDGTDDGGFCLLGQGPCLNAGGGLGVCSTCGALRQQCCGNPALQLGFCKTPGLNCVEQGKADATCVLPQRVVADAVRSVRVIFWNDSDRFLFRWFAHLSHGKFTRSSLYDGTPVVISPHSYVEWGTESNGVGTGTEGYAQYYVSQYGVSQGHLKEYQDLHTREQYGIVEVDWDNPFLGDNSVNNSFSPGGSTTSIACFYNNSGFDITHVPLDPGHDAMDIPVFFRFRETGMPSYNCNHFWVENELRHTPNDSLGFVDQAIGVFTTPFKEAGVSSWVTTGCIGTATGSPVRPAQHSTDGFWTIDIRLDSLIVTDRSVNLYSWPLSAANRFVRLEVAPGSRAHAYCGSHEVLTYAKLTTAGAIWLDNDSETWLELHPGQDADQFSQPWP